MVAASNFCTTQHMSDLAIGDWVRIDNDPVHCRVTAILVRDRGHQYEISWVANGEPRTAWVEPWRLHSVEPEA